jgi:L-cysteine desulfidase
MACGLAWIRCQNLGVQDAGEQGILSCLTRVLQNMASGLTGMICDGGNQGCTMKGIVAVDAAFRSVEMAMDGICVDSCHGINGRTPEDTMRHMGMIASPGMVKTEETIVEIMQNK